MWTSETTFTRVSAGTSFYTVTHVTGDREDQVPPFRRSRCCGCARHVNTYRCCHCAHNTCASCSVEMPTLNGVDYPPLEQDSGRAFQRSVVGNLLKHSVAMPRPASMPTVPWDHNLNAQEQVA
eukprot:6209055-Amphidinium_carterae.3